MFMQDHQICHLVCSTCFHNVLDNVTTTIDTLRIREYQTHFLVYTISTVSNAKWHPRPPITLANCCSRLLGSREVVIIILGSKTPARAYSSSTWLVGANSIHVSELSRTMQAFACMPYQLVPDRMVGLLEARCSYSVIRSVWPFPLLTTRCERPILPVTSEIYLRSPAWLPASFQSWSFHWPPTISCKGILDANVCFDGSNDWRR